VPEPEAALGRLHHQGGEGLLELVVGLVLGAVADGEELVRAEGQAQESDPSEGAERRGGQGRCHGTRSVHPRSRQLDDGEGQTSRRLGDLVGGRRVQFGEPVEEEPLRRRGRERLQLEPLAATVRDHAGGHVPDQGRGRVAVGQHEEDPLLDRAPGEVVEEAQ
jgi:hypothetical protein